MSESLVWTKLQKVKPGQGPRGSSLSSGFVGNSEHWKHLTAKFCDAVADDEDDDDDEKEHKRKRKVNIWAL